MDARQKLLSIFLGTGYVGSTASQNGGGDRGVGGSGRGKKGGNRPAVNR